MATTHDPAASQEHQHMAPPSVTFTVPCAAPYLTQSLTVHEAAHQVHAQLKHGTHTFVSKDIRIGMVHSVEDQALLGRVGFTYTFDPAQGIVIICDTDFASSQGMHLITTPEGTENSCTARAAAAGFPEDDISSSRGWNFRTPMTPGADAVFKSMARGASDSLIAALKQVPGLAVLQRTPPPDLSQEEFLALGLGWRHDELQTIRARGAADSLRRPPLKSTYGGIFTLPHTANFANVDLSTNDPYPPPDPPVLPVRVTSWKQLWAIVAGGGVVPNICSSYQYMGFPCNNLIFGGHVIMGKVAGQVTHGANHIVFIIPICQSHNLPAHNANYMAPIKYNTGVWLDNYFQ
jgi:hypothetical protein